MKSRLEELFNTKLKGDLQKEIGVENVMQVPRIAKIVLNSGVKDAVSDSKVLNVVKEVITKITGQSAARTYAKKSIAGFKLREGMPIGVMVTLRGWRMYDFLDKLINVSLPCVRDFQGVTRKFDGHGNYTLGIKDWMIFPEVDYDDVDHVRGLSISIHTTATTDEVASALLKQFKMPFKRVED
jgi:large subunit ribosomal protein L5